MQIRDLNKGMAYTLLKFVWARNLCPISACAEGKRCYLKYEIKSPPAMANQRKQGGPSVSANSHQASKANTVYTQI